MKRLYVCGSFRFTREMEELEARLKEENVEYQISKRMAVVGFWRALIVMIIPQRPEV